MKEEKRKKSESPVTLGARTAVTFRKKAQDHIAGRSAWELGAGYTVASGLMHHRPECRCFIYLSVYVMSCTVRMIF